MRVALREVHVERDLREERVGGVLACLEYQAIDAGIEVSRELLDASVGIGLRRRDDLRVALRLETDAHARGGLAFGGVEHVGRERSLRHRRRIVRPR